MSMPIRYVDSHTEGEPTRVILEGGPDLGSGSLAERRSRLSERFDDFRTAVILEPRGWDALVGALLCEPEDPSCAAGVIFFNNRGCLNMCGHGTIGLAVTLARLGRLVPGRHRIETPVGVVEVDLLGPNEAAVENVPSRRFRGGVDVDVPGLGRVRGDIAWGGNWFFLMNRAPCPLRLEFAGKLTEAAVKVMETLRTQGIHGEDGGEIDHVEFFGPAVAADAHSRNFVCCPGGAYDRSPCGTGTSAKLACLAAEGQLGPGETWIQESIIGSRFTAVYRVDEAGCIIPTIRGRAFVCGEGALIREQDDPYRSGIL